METDTQKDRDDEASRETNEEQEGKGKNALEWTVVLLGAAIVLFTFGYLTYKVFGAADAPPDLRITLGTPETRSGPVAGQDLVFVPVEVTNEGGSVAQEATIEVCAGEVECARLNFPFVPHESVQKGQVGFSAPLAGALRARVVSYRE